MYCSLVSKQNNEDPIGTAGTNERYIFVEVPLPWESKVESSRHFPVQLNDIVTTYKESGKTCRLLAFTSDYARSKGGSRRIIFYKRPIGPFSIYEKEEYVIEEKLVVPLVEAWLNDKPMNLFSAFEETTEHYRDIFICTHGSRDRCCGKFSYPLYETIQNNYATTEGNKIRVWRVSHIGGHRLAPTMIDMPEARFWGHVTEDILDTLLLRRGDVAELSTYYRGWGGINKWAQAAERELFKTIGWEWITYPKEAVVIRKEAEKATVQLSYTSHGETNVYEAEIHATKTVKTEGCSSEPKEVKQYEVQQLIKM